jgi:PAS domain S-box-containing protein
MVARSSPLGILWRYGAAALAVAAAGLLRWALPGALAGTPYLAFYPAVAVAAVLGGAGPGLLATAASFLCVDLLFDTTPGRIDFGDPVVLGRLAIFLAGGAGVSLIAGMQRAARAREHRRTEELRESERNYRIVAENTYDWEFWISPEGRFLYTSPSCHPVTGYPPEAFLDDPELLSRLIHPEDRAIYEEHRGTVGEGCATEEAEFRIIRRDGAVRWIGHCCLPVRDSDGRYLGIRGSNRDITERKQAEEALHRMAEDLARSNQDLEQFAYVASHDLQEPLRMVSGFLKLLRDRYAPQLNGEANEFISFSVDGATRMSQLINDLLAYSRVGMRGKEPEPIEANSALAGAMASLRGSIEDAGAAITHDELPAVNAEFTQLSQLFQNLIGNAIKFRKPDQPCQIHVGAQKEAGQWAFSVRDNGIGIDPKQHERVFVIFQRLHTREEYPGTGIGLAICKKIVERHGGRIWVESEPGEGSTFRFTLPGDRSAAREPLPA